MQRGNDGACNDMQGARLVLHRQSLRRTLDQLLVHDGHA